MAQIIIEVTDAQLARIRKALAVNDQSEDGRHDATDEEIQSFLWGQLKERALQMGERDERIASERRARQTLTDEGWDGPQDSVVSGPTR